EDGVDVKLDSDRLLTPSTSTSAKPVAPDSASATPQPSQRQPGAVDSAPVGRYRRPTTVVPVPDEGEPPGTFRCPSRLTPSWTTPLAMMFGDGGGGCGGGGAGS